MLNEDVVKSMVEQAGGAYVGIQQTTTDNSDLILFNDPETESTISVKANIASVPLIRAKLLRSRMNFIQAKTAKPFLSSGLHLEVQEIREDIRALLPHLCLDARGLEKLMGSLARLDVLIFYLQKR